MPTLLEKMKNLGRKIGLNDEKGYAVAVFLALIIISVIAVSYFAFFRPVPSGYSTIYVLDSQKEAVNYPTVLVANQNSTFNVWVDVVNNMGGTVKYQVLVKITDDLTSVPVNVAPIDAYNITLGNTQSWQQSVMISENQVGSYAVVFELWQYNSSSGVYQFTNNNVNDYCVLHIQVIS